MIASVIGGHPGLQVLRGDGSIMKVAEDGLNQSGIQNEARMLQAMSGSGFTPELVAKSDWRIVETDLGTTEPIKDSEAFRRNCIKLLWTLRQRNICHGDLTLGNIIVRDDWPWVVDWQEARYLSEPLPAKQPWTDSYVLMKALGASEELDSSRTARRWLVVLAVLHATTDFSLPLRGKSLLDLGCYKGDFCALAAAEGMHALGIDRGDFLGWENSIEIAKSLWDFIPEHPYDGSSPEPFRATFQCKNIADRDWQDWDVVLLFSTFPYLVRDFGKEEAEALLRRIIAGCGVLFFETQLFGDGPGPEFLATDADVADLLFRCGGRPSQLITIPVAGRDARRTVWMVGK